MNFDRVAGIYDATRALPPVATAALADRILALLPAGEDARVLELGVGTGRIALPLVERGLDVTGVDISRDMMERLREKAGDAPSLHLVTTDAAHLPFPDDSFDLVLTVHLLHLVPEWQAVLDEAFRVLEPGGIFALGHDRPTPESPASTIRRRWGELVTESGTEVGPRYGTPDLVEAELLRRGLDVVVYRVARWSAGERPIDLIGRLRDRVYSQTWDVPDEVMEGVHERLIEWVGDAYGSPGIERESHFEMLLLAAHLPVESPST